MRKRILFVVVTLLVVLLLWAGCESQNQKGIGKQNDKQCSKDVERSKVEEAKACKKSKQAQIQTIGKNEDDEMTFEEFKAKLGANNNNDEKAQAAIKEIFDKLDANDDGVINDKDRVKDK